MKIKFAMGKVEEMGSGSALLFPYISIAGTKYRCPVNYAANMLTLASNGQLRDRFIVILYDADMWSNEIISVQSP